MKLALKFFLVLVLVLALAACAPEPTPTSSAVDVPEAIELGIGALVLALLTAGFVFVFEKTRLDLRGFATPIAVTISAFLVTELQNIVNTIPETYDPTLDIFFQILVVIIGGLGVLRLRANEPARLL